jgi:uncharacterized protein
MQSKIELSISALSPSESQPEHFVLVLEDISGQRRILVLRGAPEAQAIAMSMEKIQPPRPFTHDLLKNAIETLGGIVQEALIFQIQNEIFFTKIIIKRTSDERMELDARASDAIALAIRCDAPVYCYESVLEDTGVLIANISLRTKKGSLAEHSPEELAQLLQKLIEKEDYESAARIRDYLNRQKKNK